MTPGELLAWERGQELRDKLNGGRSVAMGGGTAKHSEINADLVDARRQRLEGKQCRAFWGTWKPAHLVVDAAKEVSQPDSGPSTWASR